MQSGKFSRPKKKAKQAEEKLFSRLVWACNRPGPKKEKGSDLTPLKGRSDLTPLKHSPTLASFFLHRRCRLRREDGGAQPGGLPQLRRPRPAEEAEGGQELAPDRVRDGCGGGDRQDWLQQVSFFNSERQMGLLEFEVPENRPKASKAGRNEIFSASF